MIRLNLKKAQRLLNLTAPGRIRRVNVRAEIEAEFQELLAQGAGDEASAGRVLIDIGANEGRAYFLCHERPHHYIGIEPDPLAFKNLEKNLGDVESVSLIEAAAWVSNGTMDLYRHVDFSNQQNTTSSSLLLSKRNVDSLNSVTVETLDLSALLREVGGRAVVKIDAEGAEYRLLEALAREGKLLRDSEFFVEFHPTKLRWGRIKHMKLVATLLLLNAWQNIRLWP